jgi:hypothetical protein
MANFYGVSLPPPRPQLKTPGSNHAEVGHRVTTWTLSDTRTDWCRVGHSGQGRMSELPTIRMYMSQDVLIYMVVHAFALVCEGGLWMWACMVLCTTMSDVLT